MNPEATVQKAIADDIRHDEVSTSGQHLKLDKKGLPLSPQPSARKDDPLNWSPALKFAICLQVSLLAFLGPFGSAVINPAFVQLGRAFDITPVQASYELTVFLIFTALGPFLFIPLANSHGRRPLMLGGALLAAVTNVVAGFCPTWAGIMATRAFNGFGAGVTVALGPAVICDIYFLHERGFYMGIFALFLNNGPHFAPLVGGFVAQNLGWRSCFSIPGYIQLGMFIVVAVCFPETLHARSPKTVEGPERSFPSLLLFRGSSAPKTPRAGDFLRPFAMMRYLSVALPAIYYMTCLAYGSVLYATTASVVYSQLYGFDIIKTGLIISIPLIIGNLIGEAGAGWFIDWLMLVHAKRHGGKRPPEARLDALWLVLLLPIGIIINGVCISHAKTSSWVGNAMGMAISSVGFQVATTVIYSYCTDCYRPQSADVSAVINCSRNIFSALVSFYALPLADEIGFEYAWLVFAFINIALLMPLIALRLRGEAIRASSWQKPPTITKAT